MQCNLVWMAFVGRHSRPYGNAIRMRLCECMWRRLLRVGSHSQMPYKRNVCARTTILHHLTASHNCLLLPQCNSYLSRIIHPTAVVSVAAAHSTSKLIFFFFFVFLVTCAMSNWSCVFACFVSILISMFCYYGVHKQCAACAHGTIIKTFVIFN